jgi:serine/threonine protein kinase
MLQARRHSNITPLLGSFRAGHEDATYTHSPTRCLYLFSPLASMDMDTWLEKGAEDMSREDLRRFVYFDAMLGIASGLTYIHREIDGRVGYHRDIKPGNLLLFRKEEKGPVWKICDFGSSNLKPTGDTGTKNTVTSHYWAPIEFFEDRNGEDGQTHGRSHDIFSLGCVFLYLVTIVHCGRGDGGIPKFESLRNKGESNTGVLRNVAERGAFCKSMKAVHKWIETLQTESQSYEDKTILALINEMLQPFDERIYAWEVEIDLFILADPNQSCAEINKRLTKVIQNSRGYDAKMKLGPYERAEQKMKSQADNGGTQLRSKVFLRIIHDAGWRAYSPSSTTGSFKRNSTSQKILSTIPSSNATDILFGRQDLYERISNGFRRSDTVALYGMGGVG